MSEKSVHEKETLFEKQLADFKRRGFFADTFDELAVGHLIRDTLQEHKRELLKKYEINKTKNISYRINHCNELLEMF